ncbi:hypothetical protein WV34_03530 [Bacillus amyloliquefaciens]|uniref:DUF961 family protein n=1 Tax=Bacillaceae TaxID=186817 RepID=UPI000B51B452|nr:MULTISPECIES: DUF961 family protein [Bacillus amyloliquefaciens group]ASF27895.1 hypothetical protein WV34_03530 [Bacillus amyloliquefaciens]
MEFKTGIIPNELTFGDLYFMGLKRERMFYDRDKNERTDKLESRIYNLSSSTQKEQIEVTIPEYIDLKEIEFNKQVKLKNPVIKARAQANGNFANVIWTVEAEDIIEGGSSGGIKKNEPSKEPVGVGGEKK